MQMRNCSGDGLMSNIDIEVTIPNRNIEIIKETYNIEVELPNRNIEVILES